MNVSISLSRVSLDGIGAFFPLPLPRPPRPATFLPRTPTLPPRPLPAIPLLTPRTTRPPRTPRAPLFMIRPPRGLDIDMLLLLRRPTDADLVLGLPVIVFVTLLDAISIFIGLPSRGTPSYCFIAFTASDFLSYKTSAVPNDLPDLS